MRRHLRGIILSVAAVLLAAGFFVYALVRSATDSIVGATERLEREVRDLRSSRTMQEQDSKSTTYDATFNGVKVEHTVTTVAEPDWTRERLCEEHATALRADMEGDFPPCPTETGGGK